MWLIPSSVQSAYAQASGCSISDLAPDSNTWASAIAPLLTVSGKHTQPASYLRSWRANAWMQRLSGRTLQPSLQSNFGAWWIASQQDSHVNPIPSPASAKAPTTPDGYGPQSSESFATLVRGLWCWKTSADFFRAEEWLPYSQTWPTSGSMSNGQCWERERWAPRIDGSGSLSSAWPTATASDGLKTNHQHGTGNMTLIGSAEQWLTPHGMAGMDHTGKAGAGGEFAAMVERWPTPDLQDTHHGSRGTSPERIAKRLEDGRQISMEERVAI